MKIHEKKIGFNNLDKFEYKSAAIGIFLYNHINLLNNGGLINSKYTRSTII